VQLTIPEQFVSAIGVGQSVAFVVDAYADRQFEGKVQYVSPTLQADQRALTVEAVVPNPKGELKPGLFATARLEQQARTPGIVVPTSAVQTSGGTSRVFVVSGDHVEERIRHHRPDDRRLDRSGEGIEGRRARGDEERAAARGRHEGFVIGLTVVVRAVRPAFRCSHAMACGTVRQATGLRDRAHPVAHRHRRVLVHAPRVDRFPKIDFPTITVTTVQPGAAPEQIETEITDKIEEASTRSAGSTTSGRSPLKASRRSSSRSSSTRTRTSPHRK
jgi:hypothetical protein